MEIQFPLVGAKYCVYLHKRPDDSVFYVGKGTVKRAYEFSPTRRNQHHKNIVEKYGKENIIIQIIPCLSESEAFQLERAHISINRFSDVELANYTDGGEGSAGRNLTDAQLEAHREASRRGWDKRGRSNKVEQLAPQCETRKCIQCNTKFIVGVKKKKRFCGKNCQQRHSRSLVEKTPVKQYKNNTSGTTGVYKSKGKWIAMIGANGGLKYLGRYETKEDAISARSAAEMELKNESN